MFLSANLDDYVVTSLPKYLPTGVYYGWVQVDKGPVYGMVTSIGWNPFYKNEKKSMVYSHRLTCTIGIRHS